MTTTTTNLEEVIDSLISKYPNSIPKDTISIEELHRLIGQQDVIRYLIGQLEMLEAKNVSKTVNKR